MRAMNFRLTRRHPLSRRERSVRTLIRINAERSHEAQDAVWPRRSELPSFPTRSPAGRCAGAA